MTRHCKTILNIMWSTRNRLVKEINLPNFGLEDAEMELRLLRTNKQEIDRLDNIRWSADVAAFVAFFVVRTRAKYQAMLNNKETK